MPYQYVREQLATEESDRLSNACETPTERLVVWTLLDTGLRVSELYGLTAKDVLWQHRQLRIKGKVAGLEAPRLAGLEAPADTLAFSDEVQKSTNGSFEALEQLGDLQRERRARRSMLIRLTFRVPRSISHR